LGFQHYQIVKAIDAGQLFQMPGNSSMVKATGFKLDNGRFRTFTLTGIEITTGDMVMVADELVYDWDTRQIELRGNVHPK
jgi:lipopolysaccharide assembly outer membrane protein LptD (OstA)